MIDKLIYTFTKKLSSPEKLEKIVYLYKQTFVQNSQFHNIKLFTDNESVDLFTDYFSDIEIIPTNDIVLIDDLKFSVLPKLSENQLLIDGDVFLRKELVFNQDAYVICEKIVEDIVESKCYYYTNTIKLFIDNGIKDVVPFFHDNLKSVPNIGILYFKNKEIQQEYLDFYFKARKWFIDNRIEEKYGVIKNNRLSIGTISQYLLGVFCQYKNIDIDRMDVKNEYFHFYGDTKYTLNLNLPELS